MDRDLMYKLMMMAGVAVSVGAGVATVVLVVLFAVEHSWSYLFSGIILLLCCIGAGFAANMFADRVSEEKVFSNPVEQEILSVQQRRVLRKRRSEVLLDKALLDVENEAENVQHRRMQQSNDHSTPPHQTQFSKHYPDVDAPRLLSGKDDEYS